MKKYLFLLIALGMAFVFTACNTGNRQDISRLIDPASLPYLKNSKLIQVSSFDSSGGDNDWITIAPGKKAVIFEAEGPGMISRIWLAVDSRDPYFLRRVVIRMYWDKETRPSVEVPLGDFFGNGFTYSQYASQYLGMTNGGYVCYFPMPFEAKARIEISNETLHEISGLSYQVDYQKFEAALESDVAYFHAFWKRDIRTNYDSNYVILSTSGKGHIVGVNLNIQAYDGGLNYLDGDEMVYVDGEKKPSVAGTGTADFFSSGWHFRQGVFAGPYNGLIYKNDSLGRIAAYRLHVADPIPFRKGIKFTIEHGHANQEVADYSSTIYWYQMEPHVPFPAFPKAGQRIPLRIVKPARMLEAEKLKFTLSGLKSKVVDMSDNGSDWGDNRQLLIESYDKSSFSLTINGLKDVMYDLTLYYTMSPEYGNAGLVVNGIKAGEIKGYSPYVLPSGKLFIPNIRNKGESVELTFVITGKDPNSKGYYIGLDGVSLVPRRVYIDDWYVIGPFANPRKGAKDRRGLDSVFMPERTADLLQEYSGINGKPIHWKYVKTPESGYISFSGTMYPDELAVAYAVSYVYAKEPRKVTLYIGTDDGAKVFLNDREVYRFSGLRLAEPDQADIELSLKAGWNKVLIKIENNMGEFGFYGRLLDHDHSLVVSADQKLPGQ
jgi:hypothetical protein